MRNIIKDNFDRALIGLCVFHLIANLLWIFLSTAPIPWDQSGHTRTAMQFVNFFRSLQFWNIPQFLNISTYYPPLIHLIISIPLLLVNKPIPVSEMVITLFFLASIMLLYVYANELTRSKPIALLATGLFSFFPIVYEHSRWFLLEIPLLFFFLASVIALERSHVFTNTRYTKLFFLFAALTIMTKWLGLVYLLVPLARTIKNWFLLPKYTRMQTSYTLLFGILEFIIIALPWYLFNTGNILAALPANIQGEASDPSTVLSLQNFLFYIYLFINFQLTLFPFLLFVISIIYFFKTQKANRLFFGIMFLFIYLIFTIIPNKDWRYTMPVLPFVAIIIASFLYKLLQAKKVLGETVISIIFILLISYHLLLSFRYPISFEYQKAIQIPILGWIDYVNVSNSIVHKYETTSWPQEEILQTITRDNKANIVNVLILVDQERISPSNFILTRDLLGLSRLDTLGPPAREFDSDTQILEYLKNINYAVVPKKYIGVLATRNIAVFNQLIEAIEEQKLTNATLLKSYSLPNRDVINLYRIEHLKK